MIARDSALGIAIIEARTSMIEKGPEMTQNNPDPLEDFNEEMDMAHQLVQEAKGYEGERGGPITDHLDAAENHMQAAAAIIAQHYAPVIAENERLRAIVAAYEKDV